MANLTGNIGLNFNITESATTNVTGAVTQVYSLDTTVSDISMGTTDVVFSMYGYVGANSYQLNLNSINNVSGAGTGIDVRVVRNNSGDLSNLKYFVVYNADTTNNITLKPGSSNSLLATSEQITLKPRQAVGLAYGSQETVGATSSTIAITGSAASTYHQVFIYGN